MLFEPTSSPRVVVDEVDAVSGREPHFPAGRQRAQLLVVCRRNGRWGGCISSWINPRSCPSVMANKVRAPFGCPPFLPSGGQGYISDVGAYGRCGNDSGIPGGSSRRLDCGLPLRRMVMRWWWRWWIL